MKKISLRKKLSFYFSYRRILLNNKKELKSVYNLRIDKVNRIYTVINIPESVFEDPYNMRTADINKISEPYILEYTKQITNLLNNKGLTELFKLYDIQKIDKYSYLVIVGFSLFDTQKVAKNIFFKLIPTTIILSAIMLLIFKVL